MNMSVFKLTFGSRQSCTTVRFFASALAIALITFAVLSIPYSYQNDWNNVCTEQDEVKCESKKKLVEGIQLPSLIAPLEYKAKVIDVVVLDLPRLYLVMNQLVNNPACAPPIA